MVLLFIIKALGKNGMVTARALLIMGVINKTNLKLHFFFPFRYDSTTEPLHDGFTC